MAVILYGRELRQDQRTKRRQLEEETEARERAALGSSSSGLLGTGSDSGTDSGASSGRLPTELQAKVDTRRRHHRENSLLIMLNRPQVWRRLSISACYTHIPLWLCSLPLYVQTLHTTYQGVDAQHLGVAAALPVGHAQGAADLRLHRAARRDLLARRPGDPLLGRRLVVHGGAGCCGCVRHVHHRAYSPGEADGTCPQPQPQAQPRPQP